jgi:hypothetical protein
MSKSQQKIIRHTTETGKHGQVKKNQIKLQKLIEKKGRSVSCLTKNFNDFHEDANRLKEKTDRQLNEIRKAVHKQNNTKL